tara:strand:- start:573 stop:1583 length:1011 start_codon:yes stop_codon:yes gene_type:complete
MSRIPVSHKNRIRGETRDRIRSELNISESINSHINDFNNPHSVTKSQVGLSEVDNTSDANKPVSTAQQAALDLKEDISALGTAAYADLTTSSTDATANRVTKVGDFGLGSIVVACPNVDLNDVVVTGFYDISGATLNKPPALSPTNAVCMTIVRTSDNMVQMVYNRRSHQIFQRYKNNTWSSWTEVLTTETLNGDITITGSFLADDPATTTDWNTNWQTGFYNANSAANAPTTGWYWGLKSGYNGNSASIRYGMDLVVSLTSEIPYIRNTIINGTGTWQQIHTTGSLAFLQNQSGGTLGSTATVAGSSLFPTKTGTWRNVSGGNILNNGWGLWGIV